MYRVQHPMSGCEREIQIDHLPLRSGDNVIMSDTIKQKEINCSVMLHGKSTFLQQDEQTCCCTHVVAYIKQSEHSVVMRGQVSKKLDSIPEFWKALERKPQVLHKLGGRTIQQWFQFHCILIGQKHTLFTVTAAYRAYPAYSACTGLSSV